jgi:hypothetical protein
MIVDGVAGEALALSIAGEAIIGAGLAAEGGWVGVESEQAADVAQTVLSEEVAGLAAAAVADILAQRTARRAGIAHGHLTLEVPSHWDASGSGRVELPEIDLGITTEAVT